MNIQLRAHFSKLLAFTDSKMRQLAAEQQKQVTKGRAWYAAELRLKSNEQLHGLWYTLLKEKNRIISDNEIRKAYLGTVGRQGPLLHVKKSMARILTVVAEREKVKREYLKQLEDEYVAERRKLYEETLTQQQPTNEPYVPEITPELLRAKWSALRKGVDNTKYIEDAVQKYQERQGRVSLIQGKPVRSIEDLVFRQIESAQQVPQHEVLKSHVKNWRSLTVRQQRVALGFLNARRSNVAKREFLKELKLVGQKISHDLKQHVAAQ